VLRKIISSYQEKAGRCPASWKDLEPTMRGFHVPLDATGAPLDPTGVAYLLTNNNCDIDLGPKSQIPRM
jgi:hypothetical protein